MIRETSSKPNAKRDERTDEQAFTQVEKWMAMIREIDREPQAERKRADHDASRSSPVADRRASTK